MSLCSHTVRAISRSRASHPNTLLPFLYQTATIQQWKHTARPIARRTMSSRPRPEHDIPFEDAEGQLPPTVEEAQSTRKTTITDNERAAFEKLYKTFNTQGQGRGKGKNGEHEELDQIADEYYEDDDEGSSNQLDKLFDEVLQGSTRLQKTQKDGRNVQSKTTQAGEIVTPGEETLALDPDTPQNKKKLAATAEKERFKKLRLKERERIDELLKTAQTDVQLWQILNREIFDQLRKLDLDNADPAKKEQQSKAKGKAKSKATIDTRIFFPNYPYHLLTAVQTLRIHFPRSPLPLTILPTIKALGRSSYALGASTKLYKHLLRTAWIQQSSYALIDTLLTDMESNVVEFDLGILEMLDGIIKENDMAISGKLGREMQMVFGMESWLDGIKKIRVWRDLVAERLGVEERVVARKISKRVEPLHVGTLPLDEEDVQNHYKPVGEAVPFVGDMVLEDTPIHLEGSADAIRLSDDIQDELTSEKRDVDDADRPIKVML